MPAARRQRDHPHAAGFERAAPRAGARRGQHQHRRPGTRRAHEPARERQPQARVEHHARERAPRARLRQQQRIVGEHGADSHHHAVVQSPQPAGLKALRAARDPLRLAARGGDAPVERERGLQQHEGTAAAGRGQEACVDRLRFPGEQAGRHAQARGAEQPQAAAADARVRVADRRHHARDPARPHERRAGRRASVVRAGLERHVERRALRPRSGAAERQHLRVRSARPRVEALADDPLAPRHHAAHERVRVRLAEAARRERERAPHQPLVEPLAAPGGRHAMRPPARRRTPPHRTAAGRRAARRRRRSGSAPRARARRRPRHRPSRCRRAW